jgi:hypothetical protein
MFEQWPHLASGRGHLKTCMEASACSVVGLLRAFGVEPICSICPQTHGGTFDTHTLSQGHYQAVCDLMDAQADLNTVAELLWHETYVPGGQVKYNHLDGELQVLRDVPVHEASVIHPQDLWVSGQWIRVCAPAVVAAQPGGDRTMWPNLWGPWVWKRNMIEAADRVVNILTQSGVLRYHSSCGICSDEWFSSSHLCGPKHYKRMMDRVPQNMFVQPDNFYQCWNLPGSSMAYNHLNGSLIMLRRSVGNERVAPAAAPAIALFCLQGTRLPPAFMPRLRPPPPQPATSSTVAPPAVNMQLASQGSSSSHDLVVPAVAKSHTIGTHQPPEDGRGAFRWFWQRFAAFQAGKLEEIVVAALDPLQTAAVLPYCELCKFRLPPSVSFAQHVSTDIGHMATVSARFEQVGPDCRGWLQCWPGVAEFNHLTLDVSDLIAREGGSEVSAAVAGGRASAHEVDEQLCAAVQPVTGDDAEYQEEKEQADPRNVPADTTPWQKFLDPDTLRHWWWKESTGEFSWNEPKVSCGPTESSHTSATVSLIAGTGASEGSCFEC